MATSAAKTVPEYLASLEPPRRAVISRMRDAVRGALPKGFEETMQYGMISWVVPLSRYPSTYNGQALAVASLASQKGHCSLYLMGVYGSDEERARFEADYERSGKKLDMGKSCLRFRSLDDVALDVVTASLRRMTVDGFLAGYEAARGPAKPAKAGKAAKTAIRKKQPVKKPAKRRAKAASR